MSTKPGRRAESWGPAKQLLAAAIAQRFHLEGRTKVQIAEEFGLSRFKVGRILDAALAKGLVRVEIRVSDALDATMSEKLRSAYGLRRAVVLRRSTSHETAHQARTRLAALAADLIVEIVSPGDTLGLAWARTVNEMADALPRLAPCTVVQLCGFYSRLDRHDSSAETVRQVAALAGGKAFPIYAPLVLPDERTATALRSQPGISEAFGQFARLTAAVVAVGSWQQGQSTVYDVLDDAERKSLTQLGVTAELAAHLFDADGRTLSTGLSHHVLAISMAQLRGVPDVIALASGRAKARATDAVLRSGIVTTLVTDRAAAELLLSFAASRPPPAPATARAVPAAR
jgi:DNA-binding transcriptional regulator LsrR (DeoR family)